MYIEKIGRWISIGELRECFGNTDAREAVQFFQRFKRMGMPFGPWGNNPNKLVEIVDILDPIYQQYHSSIC